ncbi:PTS system mannose-specific transporter subunits IIAB [Raoultella planticola]|uniref:PTS system mannose-specific transporter subunits IIAB n=1 Tax=Raoultella planticola TaxID=575 RepID=A0A485B0U9_RAOPL|nr:PTS system mannose-specific transporter subunits IIAB [Raoultella planticola]
MITCHDEKAEELLDRLEKKFGPLAQCRAVNYWRNLSSNMLSRMMCDALHATDSGDGVIFLTDHTGAPPYRVAALMSHKHTHCEVISGISYPLLERMYLSARHPEQRSVSRRDREQRRPGRQQPLAPNSKKIRLSACAMMRSVIKHWY